MRILQNSPKGLYGLQVVADSEGAINRGSIYVLLGKLVMMGFVDLTKPAVDPDYPGKPRPIYRLNAEGRKVLRAAAELQLAPARVFT